MGGSSQLRDSRDGFGGHVSAEMLEDVDFFNIRFNGLGGVFFAVGEMWSMACEWRQGDVKRRGG